MYFAALHRVTSFLNPTRHFRTSQVTFRSFAEIDRLTNPDLYRLAGGQRLVQQMETDGNGLPNGPDACHGLIAFSLGRERRPRSQRPRQRYR